MNGALNIHNTDVHRESFNLHARQATAVSQNVAAVVVAGTNTIEVVDDSVFTINNYVTITEGATVESDILKIKSINAGANTLTFDRPLENGYTTAAVVAEINKDLASANGSIASPVDFLIAPPVGVIYHIHTILFIIIDGVQPTIEKFGGISALTNGLVIRQENGVVRNLVVLRSNSDMMEYFGGDEVNFIQKSGGGDWATYAIWHYEEHTRSIIRLLGDDGDSLKFRDQDDLTSLSEFEIIVQGYLEGE